MPPKRKYKQWKRDRNVPIPKRTLVRLKKAASTCCITGEESFLANDRTLTSEITEQSEPIQDDVMWERSDDICKLNHQTQTQKGTIHCENESSDGSDDEIKGHFQCHRENLSITDPCHLKEDCDYRDIDSDEASYRCKSTESEDSELEEFKDNASLPKQLYPGASITIEDSILSIMKYALRHKTSYSALSDLLSLITLHLPTESHKEHLLSLYFLKKAFSSQSECYGHKQSDIVTVHEYCPNCIALWRSNTEIMCRFCGKPRKKKTNNFFSALDIGAQLKSLFKGKTSSLSPVI